MIKPVAIVDLFSGPGGLAEGFSASGGPGCRRYQIELSVEKEPSAHCTLLLRAFLRKFHTALPRDYYDFLNGAISEPDWAHLYPNKWQAAIEETKCLELGKPETTVFLNQKMKEIRNEHGGRTVLIGGPPCQAYSLVGRARSAGIADYMPQEDERNYLYQEYVNVLATLKPAATVMENVKGMLSSAVNGDSIILKVMADLRNANGPDSYRLFALSPSSDADCANEVPTPQDFIVRTEEHGIPQARHRVIIVGLRSDVAENLPDSLLPHLERRKDKVCVNDVIGGMPMLRSGLSRADDPAAWKATVRHACELVQRNQPLLSSDEKKEFRAALSLARNAADNDVLLSREEHGGVALPNFCPAHLRDWFHDEKLERLPNNDTRGHMAADLARYLFATAFGRAFRCSPKAADFPPALAPNHKSWLSGKFSDRFRVQLAERPSSTITSHISKDGHYFIHPDPRQCRSLTVREAARLQTFPDNYLFKGNRTEQYVQVGNAVPPYLAYQIAESLWKVMEYHYQGESGRQREDEREPTAMVPL